MGMQGAEPLPVKEGARNCCRVEGNHGFPSEKMRRSRFFYAIIFARIERTNLLYETLKAQIKLIMNKRFISKLKST